MKRPMPPRKKPVIVAAPEGLFPDEPPADPPARRKAGRPKGARNVPKEVRMKDLLKLKHTHYMKRYFGPMTDAEIKKLKPLELFAGLAFIAVKCRDYVMLREVAKDWAPYEHARKNENVNLTPEEVRRIANLARIEAYRRGVDLGDTPGPSEGAVPN